MGMKYTVHAFITGRNIPRDRENDRDTEDILISTGRKWRVSCMSNESNYDLDIVQSCYRYD